MTAPIPAAIFLALLDDDEEEDGDEELDQILSELGKSKRKRKRDPLTNDVDDGEHLRVLKLLAKSMRITVAGCTPFVDEEFYRQVLKAFIYMASKNESVIQDVTTNEYKTLNIALNRCLQKRNLGFYLNGTVCDGYPKVDGIYYFRSEEYWKYRLTGYSARWRRHNPFVEAGWNAVEFVHGYCFETFVDNIMDLHTYEMALEGLFTAMVLKHWQVPVTLKQDIFWNNVLNTKDIQQTMRSLDACVIGGTKMSPFTKRLDRPYVGQEASENPKPDTSTSTVDSGAESSSNDTQKGWTKGIEAYWEWYESKGGFKEISKNFGFCINNANLVGNKDEMEDHVQSYKEIACPDAQPESGGTAAPPAAPPPPSDA
ncbi:uncharacterized protein LOC118433610 [Folsomia candida]|uniref:uncharacterized protein LOC118433610 n=1 Tax=Folsomia candida TaxID=158441 RepID=UPI001605397F|nr:uncharacterized protein LOC118433610 [Folsomia candida]